jgi:hypothetical protein
MKDQSAYALLPRLKKNGDAYRNGGLLRAPQRQVGGAVQVMVAAQGSGRGFARQPVFDFGGAEISIRTAPFPTRERLSQ